MLLHMPEVLSAKQVSRVRSLERRHLLFDMDMAIMELRGNLGEAAPVVSLTSCYHNLLRQWADA